MVVPTIVLDSIRWDPTDIQFREAFPTSHVIDSNTQSARAGSQKERFGSHFPVLHFATNSTAHISFHVVQVRSLKNQVDQALNGTNHEWMTWSGSNNSIPQTETFVGVFTNYISRGEKRERWCDKVVERGIQ
jgi:hypothetical protein